MEINSAALTVDAGITKLKKIGYAPKVDLRTGLMKTTKWYKDIL